MFGELMLTCMGGEGSNFAPGKNMCMRIIRRLAAFLAAACMGAGLQAQTPMPLDSLFSLVERGSKALQVQKTGTDAARLDVESAKSRRLPDINTSLSLSYNGNVLLTDRDFSNGQWQSSPHFGHSFSIEASQLVYGGGTVNAAIEMARLQHGQAETQTHSTREQMRFVALAQYLDLYRLQNRIDVVASNIELTNVLVADIRARREQGMALSNDVTRYELQLQNLELQLTQLRDQRKIQNYQLCHTLGLDTGTVIEPDAAVVNAAYASEGEAHWHSMASESSPALKLAAIGTKMAEQSEKIARGAMLPKVAFVAADNFNGPITFELPPIDKNLNIWYVGVGISYNLSSLFKNNKDLRRARTATVQSRQAQALAAEQLDNNVQQAYTEYMQSYVELETRQTSVELADENYRVVNERYLNQLALITDMLDASSVKLDAELSEVDARINVAYTYYKMKYIAGTL